MAMKTAKNKPRNKIAANYKAAQKEHKAGKLKFSSSVQELKKIVLTVV